MTTYTHEHMRAFAYDEANGTICEASLIAIKNLESAIHKRASISPIELEAINMIIQCADELRQHLDGKRVDTTRKVQPRELRPGLKREHAERISGKQWERYSEREDIESERIISITDSVKRQEWGFDENDRLELRRQWI